MPVDHQTTVAGVIVRLRDVNESINFVAIVGEALQKINANTVGAKLLTQIGALSNKAQFGYTICVMRPAGLAMVDKNDGKGPQWSGGSVAKRANEADACNGKGTVTAVTWNANVLSTPDGARPTFIALAHEFIHALYNLKGEGYLDASDEEYRTVGLAPVATAREITENLIRAENGVPLRATYSGLVAPQAPPVMTPIPLVV